MQTAQILKISINDDKTAKKFSKDIQQKPFKLDSKNSFLTNDGIRYLSNSANSNFIHEINLSDNYSSITDLTLQNLSKSNYLTNIKKLSLKDDDITDTGMIELLFSKNFSSVEELSVYGVFMITDVTLQCLADSNFAENLRKLDLRNTSISDKGIDIFVNSYNSQNLIELDISENSPRITDESLMAIGLSSFCNNLQVLKCHGNNISDKGVEYLFDSKNLKDLHEIDISGRIERKNFKITDYSLKNLARSDCVKNLKILNLKATTIGNEGIIEFFNSYNCRKLEILRISYNENINNICFMSLGESENLYNLKKIYVNDTHITIDSIHNLLKLRKTLEIIF